MGQTVAQWRRSCWWKKPGVQAACTDRSRVPDTRRVPVRSRGSRTFVQIEAGGFYPRFYGVYWQSVPQSDCNWKEGLTARACIALNLHNYLVWNLLVLQMGSGSTVSFSIDLLFTEE